MRKAMVFLIGMVLVATSVLPAGETASAQVIALPAEINKGFDPLSIEPGGISRLSVTVYNPNPFPLTNAAWVDNLVRVQPGLRIAGSPDVTNSCAGTVGASPAATTLSLSGGTIPGQTGSEPGRCTVSVNVTSTATGVNLINTIPARSLSATGAGTTITNTSPASATLNVGGTPTPGPTPPPPPVHPVALSKSFSPSTIWTGGTSELTIVIRNNQTNASLMGVSLSDTLPDGVTLANPVLPALAGCGASAALNAAAGGRTVTLNNGTIAPGSTCSIRVSVTSNVQGIYNNTIPAQTLRTEQGLSNPNDETARLNVQAIGISKAFSTGRISVGGVTTLTFTLQNPTGTPYTGVRFTDNLPGSLVVAVDPAASNTCGGTLSAASGSPTISLAGGTIPAGSPTAPGICTISVQVTAPPGTPSGRLTNTIPANHLGTDQGVSNPRPATDRVTVRGTDVTASKSFSPGSINVGESSRLRIDIVAPGDTNLTNFSITDPLPAGLVISNSAPAEVNGCGDAAQLNAPTGGTTISLTNALILAATRCRIHVFVTGNTAGTYTNTIPQTNITNSENRLPPNNLTDNLTVNTFTPPSGVLSMALVKGFFPREVFGGSASTMSVELINYGSVPLSEIAFTDNMPDRMILANPVNFNVGSCGGTLTGTPGQTSFSFSEGSLPALSRCTLTLSVTMTVNGNLTNVIPARSVTTTEGATNIDPAEASLTNLPGASIGKYFTPRSVAPGAYSLLTITIQNTGNVPLSGMQFSDSLPAGLEIAGGDAPAPVNGCSGTLTAVAGTQLIQLNGGAMMGNTACAMVIPVTGNDPGAYQNTIPAGSLRTDSVVSVTNVLPATDTLTITENPGGPEPTPPPAEEDQGGKDRGRNRTNNPSQAIIPVTGEFLIPVTGFAPEGVTRLEPSSRTVYDSTSLLLEIPVLKIKAPIVGVPSAKGNWDVSWLQDQIGWLNGTAYPTWKGNSVLTAHVANADGKPGVFANLKGLGVGEYVFMYNAGYRYTYKVVSNEMVEPTDSRVMKHEEQSYLTLITCDGYDQKTGTYLRRVAVRAVLADVSPAR